MREPLEVSDRSVRNGSVRVLTLHRPEDHNALDAALLAELLDALDDAVGDPQLRGVVLTGGSATFSGGTDVDREPPDDPRRWAELFTAVSERLTLLELPTAAAIEGIAGGAGAELAAACDLRVAAASTVLRFTGAGDGIALGTARTIGAVGLSIAKDWVLSGRDVPADEAYRYGFVQRLVPDTSAESAALEWLEQVAGNDPATVRLLKRLFNEQSGLRDRLAFENDVLRSQVGSGRLPDLGSDLPRTIRPRRR